MAVKYYAVAVGKKPGIYTKWDECKAMVHGFPGAVYKSFKTLEEAETFLESAPARGGETHAKGAAQQKATQGAAQQKSGTAGDGKAETRGAESAGETETLADARWQSGIVRPGHGAPFYSAYRDSGDGGDDKKRGKPCAGEYDGGGLRMQRQGGATEPGVE